MRRIVTIAFGAGLLAASLPAFAANSAANSNSSASRSDANAHGQSQANNDPNRRICVREAGSETRVRRQICHTAREWRDLHGDEDENF